jgi:CoA-transferase family III
VLTQAWQALGGDPTLTDRVSVESETGLVSALPVDALSLGAVAAGRLAAEELLAETAGDGGRMRPVVVDARHVGFAVRSERFARLAGEPIGAGFAPLSRLLPAADGWVRLHANYPWHREAVHRALGADPVAAIAEGPRLEVEDAVVAAGGAAAAVRTPDEWEAHPQCAAVRRLPLLELRQVGPAPALDRRLPGLRVLDLTRVIAGPVGTRTLASYGADVLRIDGPRVPEDPAALLDTGPGKRHAVLDLDLPADRARFDDLLAEADVLVQGYRPGALAAYGLDSAALAERCPGLVVVRLSAWGATGPWAGRRGFDSIVQAASGIAAVTAAPDGTPGVLPAQALDHAAGHLVAATVLRAVTESRRQGGTWHGTLSLAQLAAWLLGAPRPSTHPPAATVEADPTPYLVDLDSPRGVVTLVRPPGSPVWTRGPVPTGYDEPVWLPRRRLPEG